MGLIWRIIKRGIIAVLLIWLAHPLPGKMISSYHELEIWMATQPLLNWAPTMIVLIVAVLVCGIASSILMWTLIYWRFRGMVEIKVYDNPITRDSFQRMLIVGEDLTDPQVTHIVCYIFFDLFFPKGVQKEIRKDQEGRLFELTDRTAEEHLWSVATCWIGNLMPKKKKKKKNPQNN